MDFQNLRDKLREKKLNLTEYFKESKEVVKVFLKENKLWTVFFIIANIWMLFSATIQKKLTTESYVRLYDSFSYLISMLNTVASVYSNLFYTAAIMKIGFKIENREDEFTFKKLFLKFLMLTLVYFVISVICGFLTLPAAIILLYSNASFLGMIIAGIIIIAVIVFGIIMFLYFIQIYCIRKMMIFDVFQYNLEISEGNRMRAIIPIIIFVLLNAILRVPFSLHLFDKIPLIIIFPISVIGGIISSFLGIFISIMGVIIFLNVEYDYLKKQNKNLQ
ncbi:hypothetical protein JCM16775_1276 [Leptotrichia hofstadii]|uniref:Glycerophosphoryl diester phosphodiesterase membrane domain-containing protein n=1 Tax=Leptotrichia hofstadii TaxID=157688 RepID=A0A510JH34_9FUSO|nr:hypothetical protein [Leptotrichia hofstadii]BBM38567.1 hypothetical protein JCM16775_1276 [Leptotrichia hofstadii]